MQKKVRVRGKLIAFDSEKINQSYNLEPVHDDGYKNIFEDPNYAKVIKPLINVKVNGRKIPRVMQLISKPRTSHRYLKCGIVS